MERATKRLTGRELAEVLGLTVEAVRQAANRGKLTTQLYNGMRTYDIEEAIVYWPERAETLRKAQTALDALQGSTSVVPQVDEETMPPSEDLAILAPLTDARARAVQEALVAVYDGIPSAIVSQLEAIRFDITVHSLEQIEIAYDLLRPYGKFSQWCEVQGLDASTLHARFNYLRRRRQVHAELTGERRPGTLAAIAHGYHTTREERMVAHLRHVILHNDFPILWDGMLGKWVQSPDTAPEVKERCRLLASLLTEVSQ